MKSKNALAEGGAAEIERVAEQYLNEFGKLAETNNTMIIPSNLSDVAGMVATATSVIKNKSDFFLNRISKVNTPVANPSCILF
ncbi:MAG: band-7 C-terminal domain-containing protein [Pseudomonadota bacterium]